MPLTLYSHFSESLWKDLADISAQHLAVLALCQMLQGPRAETQELDFFYFFGKHKSVQAEAQLLPFLVFQKSRNQLLIPLEGLCMWGGLSLSCPVFLLHSGPNNWGGQKLKAQYSRKTVTQRQQEIISERLLEQFCPHV